MKKIFSIVALFATGFVQHSFAQDSTKILPSQILTSYYNLKDALVGSNGNAATASATALVKAINETDKERIKDENRNTLLSDANGISQNKDIKVQREIFERLSTNMVELAKTGKLSTEPVYQQFCPMKKASWLSSSKAIKNPYYGSAMLTCGSIKETL